MRPDRVSNPGPLTYEAGGVSFGKNDKKKKKLEVCPYTFIFQPQCEKQEITALVNRRRHISLCKYITKTAVW